MHAFYPHDLISSFLTASLEDWVSYYRLFFTDGKTKTHRGGAGCLSPIAQHWHSDSRVHACDCSVLLALHVTVVCQTPRASMVNKKTWSLTLKELSVWLNIFRPCTHCSCTCIALPGIPLSPFSLPRWFLLILKSQVRHDLLQPFLTPHPGSI